MESVEFFAISMGFRLDCLPDLACAHRLPPNCVTPLWVRFVAAFRKRTRGLITSFGPDNRLATFSETGPFAEGQPCDSRDRSGPVADPHARQPQFQIGPIGVRVQHGPKLPPL